MVKEQLTDRMIAFGAKLTAKLDSSGLPVVAALWFLLPEANEWRLFFASPEVSAQGPRSVYQKIQTALDELGGDEAIPLSMIGVLDADADLVRLMKAAVRTGSGIAQIRFSKNVINGHFIDDALIYRAA
jgi:hypothetical protein